MFRAAKSPGSGDNLVEQARPLLQAEDIRALTGGELGLLEARDSGFFSVEMPEFWHRPELSGCLRDVRAKPGKYGRSGSVATGSSSILLPCLSGWQGFLESRLQQTQSRRHRCGDAGVDFAREVSRHFGYSFGGSLASLL